MTQEEKQLLLQDLCARLPYGVKVRICDDFDSNIEILTEVDLEENRINGEIDTFYCIDNVKLYLRPMSSMTEEERLIYEQRLHDVGRSINVIDADDVVPHIDWLNKHYLDYRGLIPMGLALEAKEGMYKETEK